MQTENGGAGFWLKKKTKPKKARKVESAGLVRKLAFITWLQAASSFPGKFFIASDMCQKELGAWNILSIAQHYLEMGSEGSCLSAISPNGHKGAGRPAVSEWVV